MRQRFFLSIIIALFAFSVSGSPDETELLKELDDYVAKREYYMHSKEMRLDSIKSALHGSDDISRANIINNIFLEYYTYNYDSAAVYARRQMEIAQKLHLPELETVATIHQALSMSIGGFYSQAETLMLSIDEKSLSPTVRFYYFYTMLWLYNYWRSYCSDEYFTPKFLKLQISYIGKALEALDSIDFDTQEPCQPLSSSLLSRHRAGAFRAYLHAEKMFLLGKSIEECAGLYRQVMQGVGIDDRIYACSAYGAARCYRLLGDHDHYMEYIVNAAISDIVCPLKENLAMQELSLYLFERNPGNSERALRYINCSMADAQFYNNRLRIIEISKIMPIISTAYQSRIRLQEQRVRYTLIVVSMLAVALIITLIFFFAQNRKLHLSRQEVEVRMVELKTLNERLEATNRKRETYLWLFMDISAAFIRKLGDYRKMVSQKIKAGQGAELLRQLNSYKIAEEESTTFNTRFDKAFLELYPNFVAELNELLTDDNRIVLPTPTSLTTEARIYALMRLGVTESSKIATLLFYSPQTIYNYKTAMRNKAKNRENFEADINRLCKIIA